MRRRSVNQTRSIVMNTSTFSLVASLAATLLLVGQLLYIVVTQFHTEGTRITTPPFSPRTPAARSGRPCTSASSRPWRSCSRGRPPWSSPWTFRRNGEIGLIGAAAAVAALALYGALQAVDGVANKQADVAWVNAPEAEKAARFASAEAMRWVEWGCGATTPALGLALLPGRGRSRADRGSRGRSRT